jgi:hypothetical protein
VGIDDGIAAKRKKCSFAAVGSADNDLQLTELRGSGGVAWLYAPNIVAETVIDMIADIVIVPKNSVLFMASSVRCYVVPTWRVLKTTSDYMPSCVLTTGCFTCSAGVTCA